MIYLDHHAASPLGASARAALDEAREVAWANPSSVHAAGRAARSVVERARERVAAAVGAAPADLIFTAGGTEACNLGVLGLADGVRAVLSSAIEHPAVAAAVDALGARVIRLEVPAGRPPAPAAFAAALEGVDLAAIQWVNHETGTVLPVADYARACRAAGVPLFVDATQALGKRPVDVGALGATAVAFASSKIGGPPAAGALWIARDAPLTPRALGGAQERGRRAGSPDPVALAGFGGAASAVGDRLDAMPAVAARRDHLEAALVAAGASVNGDAGPRVPTVTNVSVPGWRGPRLVAALDLESLCASSGAACSSGLDEPSPVLAAMYPDAPWRAESALRLSLGPDTRDADVAEARAILARVLARKRQ
ncbi:MAG TPA: aminotransferase class V-fold PLP-dependent enzyme [Sandaracinaceae bacterium LLY-WYZ-13_1]|nr:aminotransferase class V-fold PLP-dependent enzyme [Sandaracinaceae bacterium LLY-WYZ-13_1]